MKWDDVSVFYELRCLILQCDDIQLLKDAGPNHTTISNGCWMCRSPGMSHAKINCWHCWMRSSRVKLLNLPLKIKRSIQLQNCISHSISFVTDAVVGNFFSCHRGPSVGQFSVDHIGFLLLNMPIVSWMP